MSAFVDTVLAAFAQPSAIADMVLPGTDETRCRKLLIAAFAMPHTVHKVKSASVASAEYARPLFAPSDYHGTVQQTAPGHGRAELGWSEVNRRDPIWVDVIARVTLSVVLEIEPAQLDSVTMGEITGGPDPVITATLKGKKKPAGFNPNDPKNVHTVGLDVAVLIRDALDVSAALRSAKHARTVLERTSTYADDPLGGEVRTPYAPIVVFPQASLTGAPVTQAQVEALFAAEHVLPVFRP